MPTQARETTQKTVHEACVEMIESAVQMVRKPASQDGRDALQNAYLATFSRCLKHGVESIEQPVGYIATTMANFRKATYRTYAFRNVRDSFEELQEASDRSFRSVTLTSDAIAPAEAVEMTTDSEAATHLQPYISDNMSRDEIIVQLAYISGMTVPEIAEKIGKSADSVYKIKKSGELALKASFEAFEESWTVNTAKNYLPKVFIFALIGALVIGGLVAISEIGDFLSEKFGRNYAREYRTEMRQRETSSRRTTRPTKTKTTEAEKPQARTQ